MDASFFIICVVMWVISSLLIVVYISSDEDEFDQPVYTFGRNPLLAWALVAFGPITLTCALIALASVVFVILPVSVAVTAVKATRSHTPTRCKHDDPVVFSDDPVSVSDRSARSKDGPFDQMPW